MYYRKKPTSYEQGPQMKCSLRRCYYTVLNLVQHTIVVLVHSTLRNTRMRLWIVAQLVVLTEGLHVVPHFRGACNLRPSLPAFRSALGDVRLRAVDDKKEVVEYFDNEGFNRWSRIYSDDGEVNSVQLDIRIGHAQTVDKVLRWVDADNSAKNGETFCDAGCGVGSLSIPLAQRGAQVIF